MNGGMGDVDEWARVAGQQPSASDPRFPIPCSFVILTIGLSMASGYLGALLAR